MSGFDAISWSFGLRNSAGNYLTAEAFGFSINATGKLMKKKQIFFLEQNGNDAYIKTHLGRYLTFKEDGKFLANAEKPGPEEALIIEAQDDGRWCLKTTRGYYAGGNGEALDAYTKDGSKEDRKVVIRNVNRKRYVRLNGDTLTCDQDIPWGAEAMMTVTFHDGKYALETDDGRFLSETSELKPRVDESCKFTLDFCQQMVAFRSSTNKYITALGGNGLLKATKEGPPHGGPSVDEFFLFEDSQPQFKLKSLALGQFASIKRSIEVQCSQPTCEHTEIFQFEINPDTKQATTPPEKRGPNEWFTAHWLGPHLALQAANGNFITVKPNGGCFATSPTITKETTFIYEIINRPKLVLRGEHGFVGVLPSGLLESNKSVPEVFSMHVSAGFCKISGPTGKYWKVTPTGITTNGDEPDLFTMEFVEHSKFLLKAPNGKYLQGQQAGG